MLQKNEKLTEILTHGYSTEIGRESYPMNTNMTGFRRFFKSLHSCALDENIPSPLEGINELQFNRKNDMKHARV